jgi:hypothetical protein
MCNLPVKVLGATLFIWMTFVYGGTSVSAGCEPEDCSFNSDQCNSMGGTFSFVQEVNYVCDEWEFYCDQPPNQGYYGTCYNG